MRLRQALCREAERNFSIVEESLRREASAFVKDLITQAFQEFRSQSNIDAQPGTVETGTAAERTEPHLEEEHKPPDQHSTVQTDTLAGWDLNIFNIDAFTMLGDEELGYDGDMLFENVLRPTNADENGKKLSDSGYDSGSPETQR